MRMIVNGFRMLIVYEVQTELFLYFPNTWTARRRIKVYPAFSSIKIHPCPFRQRKQLYHVNLKRRFYRHKIPLYS